jgi:hypothetical protein
LSEEETESWEEGGNFNEQLSARRKVESGVACLCRQCGAMTVHIEVLG